MKFYFAPMEGVTGYVYRNAHATYFNQVDKYFMPFIAAKQTKRFSSKELKDLLPENNKKTVVIPQILTNNAENFIETSKQLKEFGYDEINLNLGCPSGTVVAKKKGSGFLAYPEELNRFLDEIFNASVTKISIKTRIGKDHPEEFYQLMEIYNQYPMEEVIVHPRIQTDYYKNKPNLTVFKEAQAMSKNSLCYNGDIFTVEEYNQITTEFPTIEKVMLGRGVIANPGLIHEIIDGVKLNNTVLKQFHDQIYQEYQAILFGDRNILFKMKELWFYMIHMFPDNEKYAKKIKKCERLCDYEEVVSRLFGEKQVLEYGGFYSSKSLK